MHETRQRFIRSSAKRGIRIRALIHSVTSGKWKNEICHHLRILSAQPLKVYINFDSAKFTKAEMTFFQNCCMDGFGDLKKGEKKPELATHIFLIFCVFSPSFCSNNLVIKGSSLSGSPDVPWNFMWRVPKILRVVSLPVGAHMERKGGVMWCEADANCDGAQSKERIWMEVTAQVTKLQIAELALI